MTTTEVENFPGFPDGGISGPELMDRMRKQALDFGTRSVMEDVTSVDLSQRPFKVTTSTQTVEAHSLIISTGATAKRLWLDAENDFWSKGMSACAVCDGALPPYRNKELIVIGGGDTACEEAQFLTKFASKVYLVHRRDELRASKIMGQRTLANPKIEVIWNHNLVDVKGDGWVETAVLENTVDGSKKELSCSGIFYGIGHKPNTGFLEGQIATDETGYIEPLQAGSTATSVEGVFACGDVVDQTYRQAITAAGSGCAAALDAERWLSEQGIE